MTRRFSVTVRGRLEPDFGRAFGAVETVAGDERSVVSGDLVDAAFLDGILVRLRDLGYELVRVETSEDVGQPAPARSAVSPQGGNR